MVLDDGLGDAELLVLLTHDSDAFNRWEASQRLALNRILGAVRSGQPLVLDAAYLDAMRADITGVKHTDDEVKVTIRRVFEEHGYLLDPHSAIGYMGITNHLSQLDGVAQWRKAKDKRSDRARRFLRVRTVNPAGQMVSLGAETAADRHWSELYSGQLGYAFYGHDPALAPPEPRRRPHSLGLDTGCCFGGRLSAAVVEAGHKPEDAAWVSVPARRMYAEPKRFREE